VTELLPNGRSDLRPLLQTLAAWLIQDPAPGCSIVNASAVCPHFVRPKPIRADLNSGQLAGQSDPITKVELRMVQNSTDCFLQRGLADREIYNCRLRFGGLDPEKPSLFRELFPHRSIMCAAVI
jgi:hypothetical protein